MIKGHWLHSHRERYFMLVVEDVDHASLKLTVNVYLESCGYQFSKSETNRLTVRKLSGFTPYGYNFVIIEAAKSVKVSKVFWIIFSSVMSELCHSFENCSDLA